jgi:small subunit ribosomal protein S16
VSVKIKLKRLGKKKNPQYRIVIADSRTARGGRSIEEIGIYQPRREPSLIQVDSERAQYWLGVGAQPTEPVMAILKVTGDWQKFKGLPGAEGTLRVAEPKADKQMAFEAAVKSAEEAGKAPKAKAPSLKESAAVAGATLAEKATEAKEFVAEKAEEVKEAVAEKVEEAKEAVAERKAAKAAEAPEAEAPEAEAAEAPEAEAPAAEAPAAPEAEEAEVVADAVEAVADAVEETPSA